MSDDDDEVRKKFIVEKYEFSQKYLASYGTRSTIR
jgi:hypothetical protein